MQVTPSRLAALAGPYRVVKAAGVDGPPAQRDPAVVATVSQMLSRIEAGGMAAVLSYARDLDGWSGGDVELAAADFARIGDGLSPQVRAGLELGHERTTAFARQQRAHLVDFEVEIVPGLITGQRYVPVPSVGAYLPAGRFPLTTSAHMTVGVAKVAGVPNVIACTPPRPDGSPDPAVTYTALLAGTDRVFVLGGVQALAAMAFGLLGKGAVDMLVGAGNAFVAEAKRQLFGRVGIDLLAGPSEVAVIADETADAELVAADLLGQAEHGPTSPAALVTTSLGLAEAVVAAADRQLATLETRAIAGPAWRDYGTVTWVADADDAVTLMDSLAPEHLEVHTADDEWFFNHLTCYGSLFLGPWSTVAYSDKGISGSNHVLPTAGNARHSAGLSVSRFLKPLTYQRVQRAATPELATAVRDISAYEGLAAHEATAVRRLSSYQP